MIKYQKEIGVVAFVAFVVGVLVSAGYIYSLYTLFERSKNAVGGLSEEIVSLVALLQERSLIGFAAITFWWICICWCFLTSLLKEKRQVL